MSSNAPKRRFPTTRWSQIVAAGATASPVSRAAMATLCETYWQPVFEFVRYWTRPPDDARDLTQAFFARVLERGDFRQARPERGRFRSFLLTSVKHFLSNQAEHDRALKRGGGQVHVPIEPLASDDRQTFEPVSSGVTPETIFEEKWALTVLDAAMTRLTQEYEQGNRRALFDALRPHLTGDGEASYAECAEALKMSEGAVRVAVHRLRRSYGRCLRETLADTVDDPADVDAELDYLLKVIARRQPSSAL